jgi:hypothetical protein
VINRRLGVLSRVVLNHPKSAICRAWPAHGVPKNPGVSPQNRQRDVSKKSCADARFGQRNVDGAELRDAETVLAQLGTWFEDYNTRAPHSALAMRSPSDYRAWAVKAAVAAVGDHDAVDREARIWLRTRDRAGGRYLGSPRKSDLRAPVRIVNLSSPPEQKNGEHSRRSWRPASFRTRALP